MSIKQIKGKIRAVHKTHQVTRAMEAVSAVKMRKSQERALTARPYARSALSVLHRVSGSMDIKNHLFTAKRSGKLALVLITSDKGLAGSLNSSALKAALEALGGYEKEDVSLLCLGKKGAEFFEKRGYTILFREENVSDEVPLSDMRRLLDRIVVLWNEGGYAEVRLVYTNFISTFEQRAVLRTMLPLSVPEVEKIVQGIAPQKGKYAQAAEFPAVGSPLYLVEPSPERVFAELIPFLAQIFLYHALLESKASEHSARMVAMKNASDKAKELTHELTLEFNKVRQTVITREVSEIVGGIEAMA